jgi:nucleoside-triphosphatase
MSALLWNALLHDRGVMSREPRALLLTGAPGTGKTTVIQKVATALSERRLRGFVTGEIRRAGHRVGFELTTLSGQRGTLAHVDIESRHRVGRYGVDVAALDGMVDQALALDDATDLYLVDEIGKMECFSPRFREVVHRLLGSGRTLVATVALRGSGFVAEVKSRDDIELWKVTRETRDQLPDRIVEWVNQAPARR